MDLKDYPSYHLLAMDGDVIAGYLRIIPQNIAFRDVAIGRVIVMKKYRGRAISREMMTKAMQFIKDDLKKDKIRLSGQAYLSDFYISLGFKRVSELYLEDGIEHYEFLYDGNDLNEH